MSPIKILLLENDISIFDINNNAVFLTRVWHLDLGKLIDYDSIWFFEPTLLWKWSFSKANHEEIMFVVSFVFCYVFLFDNRKFADFLGLLNSVKTDCRH